MTPSGDNLRPLEEFLRDAFAPDQLRRFIRQISVELADELPGASVSHASLSSEVVAQLVRHGMLNERFFAQLRAARPARATEVDALAAHLRRRVDESAIAQYRARLAAQLRQKIHLSDIDTDVEDTELRPTLDILQLFVPQQAIATPPDAHQKPPRIPNTGLAQFEHGTRPVDEVIGAPQHPWILLLGAAGAGKTTLARWVALRLCTDEPVGSLPPGLVPVFVDLRHFAGQSLGIFEYLETRHNFLRLPLLADALHALAESKRIVWILDGFDEITDVARRRDVGDAIVGLREDFPCRGIITGRLASSREFAARLPVQKIAHFTLLEFDDHQIDLFLQRWHALALPDAPELAQRRLEHLRRGLRDNLPLRELARNPLLLSLLAVLNRGDELPHSRRELLQRASSLLLERWDTRRGIPNSTRFRHEDKHHYLSGLALHMLHDVPGGAGNIIPGEKLRSFTEQFCIRRFSVDPSTAHSTASTLLKHLHERNDMLGPVNGDAFGFLHRAFLEFFAADEMVQRFQAGLWTSEDIKQLFAQQYHDSAWRESLSLVCDLLWQTHPEQAIPALQAAVTANPLSGDGFPLHLLALMVQCLREAPLSRFEAARQLALVLNEFVWANYRLLFVLSGEKGLSGNPVPMAFKSVGDRWPDVPNMLEEISACAIPPALSLGGIMTFTATYSAEFRTRDYIRRICSGDSTPTLVLAAQLDGVLSPTEIEVMERDFMEAERPGEEGLALAVALLCVRRYPHSSAMWSKIESYLPLDLRQSSEARAIVAPGREVNLDGALRLAAFALLRARPYLCEDSHILTVFRPPSPQTDQAREDAVLGALGERSRARRDPFIAVTAGWLHSTAILHMFLESRQDQPDEAIRTAAVRISHWDEGLQHLRVWGRAHQASNEAIEYTSVVRINDSYWLPPDRHQQLASEIVDGLCTGREEPNWEALEYFRCRPLLGLPPATRIELVSRIQQAFPGHSAEIGLILLSSDLRDPQIRTRFVALTQEAIETRPLWGISYICDVTAPNLINPEFLCAPSLVDEIRNDARGERDLHLLYRLGAFAKRIHRDSLWRPMVEDVLERSNSAELRLRAALTLESREPLLRLQESTPNDPGIQAAVDLFDARERLLRVGKPRRAVVCLAGTRIGTLTELPGGGSRFLYDPEYLSHLDAPPVAPTLPLRAEPYDTQGLHPIFAGLLPEGWLRDVDLRKYNLKPGDDFGLLLATGRDTIGAIEIIPEE